ncbi:MAG: hypothetical protein BGO12_05190 [Verrucomicrobia bacterium 61-8]|nr:DUF2264 domain-containing protein [Verrucomicrobiota bacterium]OJU98121.1 MAG: hypothetical protein BGO12_05190 [Verrucomicrobia bacterium 61-8]
MNERYYWTGVLKRIASPVLLHLSRRTLRERMPVESGGDPARQNFTHLEAIGRLLAGIAPWIELAEEDSPPLARQALDSLDAATDPASPDFCNFSHSSQPLVDAAFLCQGLLRAPRTLWEPLDLRVKQNVIRAVKQTRAIRAFPNNWILFSAMVETALFAWGEPDWDRMRIDYAIRQYEQWYLGDGVYGDGSDFHADYYNSFVIQPMMVDILRHMRDQEDWDSFTEKIIARAQRGAAILERLISPEGTFPPLGRSLAYRFGTMHLLAQAALLHFLPETIQPAQVREALGAVIRRMVEAPGTFDANGWLRIGFCGHQPEVAESYISTGSLYLCATVLLPLGLSADAPFWSDPPSPWTSVQAWGGLPLASDRSLNKALR